MAEQVNLSLTEPRAFVCFSSSKGKRQLDLGYSGICTARFRLDFALGFALQLCSVSLICVLLVSPLGTLVS